MHGAIDLSLRRGRVDSLAIEHSYPLATNSFTMLDYYIPEQDSSYVDSQMAKDAETQQRLVFGDHPLPKLQHRFFISSDRCAVYESTPTGIALLLWHNGRKARLPVDSLPPDAKGLLCPDYRAWEWASEEWDA